MNTDLVRSRRCRRARGVRTACSLAPVVTVLAVGGCATVPPEAPAAARDLDARLERFEDAHVVLLGALFDAHRDGLERFVETRWQPRFVDEFLTDPESAAFVDGLAGEEASAEDRRAWFALVLPVLQRGIDAERRALVEPLERLETETTRRARDAFADARLLARSLQGLLDVETALATDVAALPAAFGIGPDASTALGHELAATAGALVALVDDLRDGRAASGNAVARLEALRGEAGADVTDADPAPDTARGGR